MRRGAYLRGGEKGSYLPFVGKIFGHCPSYGATKSPEKHLNKKNTLIRNEWINQSINQSNYDRIWRHRPLVFSA